MFSRIREHLSNLDRKGRRLAWTSIFFATATYICRAQSDEFILMGFLANFFLVFSLPLILAVAIWFVVHIFAVIRYTLQTANSRLAVILPTVGIIIALFSPIPPLKERSFFLAHQSEYAKMVELAQSEQLSHDDKCRAETALAPPRGYEHLTGNCIFVDDKGVVEFTPYTFYMSISYFETVNDIKKSSWCYSDGVIWDQIDSHWYICKLHFN